MVDAEAEPERAQDRELRLRIGAIEIRRWVRFGIAAHPRVDHRLFHRTAGRFDPGEHGIRGAVENADDPRQAITGQPFAHRAHDRHRAADGGFEPQLPALTRRERQERRAALRDHLLVRRDDRLARGQRRVDPVGCRLEAADRLDDDVGVRGENVVESRRPGNRARTRDMTFDERVALHRRPAVEDVREFEAVDRIRAGEA